MRVFAGLDEVESAVGADLGYSDWHTVTQESVQLFADATGDHQWIHLDVERAKAGPFGGTIQHGYMTLSLLPVLVQQVYRVEGIAMGINYGMNKVRFPAPVPVGSRVRAHVVLAAVERTDRGAMVTAEVVIELGARRSRPAWSSRCHCSSRPDGRGLRGAPGGASLNHERPGEDARIEDDEGVTCPGVSRGRPPLSPARAAASGTRSRSDSPQTVRTS